MRGIIGLAALLVAVALAWPLAARAGLPETPRPRQFTVADGLPSNRINAIAQDHAGYLWVATSDGLARFDGVGFRVWRVEQGLRDNFVWTVHVDAQDRVWIGTRSAGLAVFDAQRRHLTWFDRTTPGVGGVEVWSIASTPDGSLWFGTGDAGLHRLRDGRVQRWMPIPGNARSLPDAGIRKLQVMRDGTLWVGTGDGVARWTGRDFERIDPAQLPSTVVNGLAASSDGGLWIGTTRGLVERDPGGRMLAPPWLSRAGTLLQMLVRDREGTHWFDVPDGLGVESVDGVAVVPLYSAAARGLVRPSWVEAREDHEGGLWFASNTSGLWYLPPRWRQFSVLSRRLDDPTSLANAQVRGIAPSRDGSIWLVGSGGVLDRFDSETGAVEHVVSDVGQGVVLDAVLEDRDGRVWVTYPDGLARIDVQDGRIARWAASMHNGALAGDSTSIVQDAAGRLWIAGEGGVQLRDVDGRVLASMLPGDRYGLPRGATVSRLVRTPQGQVWVATSAGLFERDDATGTLRHVGGTDGDAVFGIAFDGAGDAWLARFGALERWSRDAAGWGRRDRFDAETGFPRLAPSGLVVDTNGVAWATSVRGLVRVDPTTRRSRIYSVRDGLPSQEFADPPVARPGDGRILAGTPEGIVVFDPAVVRPSTQAPPLLLEAFNVYRDGERVELDPAAVPVLAHDDRDLRVRVRLMAFNEAGANAYRFRLLGYDPAWVDVGASGERVFSQLPPGDYRLQAMARTADQAWSAPREVAFRVRPPWWQTWWARTAFVLATVLLAAAAAAAYRERLRRRHAVQRMEHERRHAEETSIAKTRFLATFGHEVRTPMTGVLGMTELLQDTALDARQRGYVDAIRGAGQHLLRLLNDALDLARIDSGHLELDDEPFDVRAMLQEVAALVGPLAARRGLAFTLAIGDDVPRAIRGDCSRLRQVLLNLLGNAQKFTERGSIALDVQRVGNDLRFRVVDTGPGLSPDQSARLFKRFQQADGARTAARYGGSGLGLAICLELTEAMGGRIGLSSVQGEGSTFSVDLPLREAEWIDDATSTTTLPSTPRSILLVEDDATVAEVVAGLLRAQGHRVQHVPHALAALTEARVGTYDVALLDLDLPGLDGFALARQLRATGFDAPMIAVTARADAESEPMARAAGFDGFVRKPVTGELLRGALDGVFARVRH